MSAILLHKSLQQQDIEQRATYIKNIIIMNLLDLESMENLSLSLKTSILKLNQLSEYEQNSCTEKQCSETKQCFDIFMKLGNHLHEKMLNDIKIIEENMNKNNQMIPVDGSEKENKSIQLSDTSEKIIEQSNLEIDKIPEEELDIRMKCVKCPFTALKKSNIELHNQHSHQGIVFPCKKCKFVAPNLTVLKGHTKLEHEKPQMKICLKCGFESDDLIEFKKHQNIVHSKKSKITQYRQN